MLGLRNLYRVFNESRASARRRATLAVTGSLPEAVKLAQLLDARRDVVGADVLLTLTSGPDGGMEVSISGDVVEDERTFSLSAVTEETVLKELAPLVAGALEEDYLVSLGRG
ncbi:MAG: hypothetical protein WKF67_06995, partial [Rubrobacteraceae bacterium]